MALWRLVLALLGLTGVGLGFACLFNPDELAALASVSFLTPAGRTDFRAMYGGLEFGVGAFLLICALRREFVRVGLFAGACALVAMGTSRSVGLALDGFAGLQFLFALTELVGGVLATWGAVMARGAGTVPTPIEGPTQEVRSEK
jgi:hypothetical protein